MGGTAQKDLALIHARQLAEQVASAVFVVDAEGALVYYNHRAEAILGERFEDAGPMPAQDWATRWDARDPEVGEVPLNELPLAVAFQQQRPAHRPLLITSSDGTDRTIEVTAFPLLSREDILVGALAIFWERSA